MIYKGTFLASVFFILFFSLNAKAAEYRDVNGLVVIEAENLTGQNSNWKRETAFQPYTGESYIRWNGSNNFSSPGSGVINAKIKINNTGVYRVMLRNKVGYGTNTTEHNDTWVKFPGVSEFYGKKGTHKVYPKGSGKTPNPEGASKDGWLKVYCHGTTAWSWRSKTNDNDPHEIFVEFAQAGEYQLSLSGRSQHHCVDRIVLYKSSVAQSEATDLTKSETLLNGDTSALSRIAILADGNSPDPDDIGATAVSLAILRALKAEKRLVFYAHSCDLVRNNTKISEAMEQQRQALMQTSCDGTAEKWGGFEHLTFYNCRTQQELATENLVEAINASSELSPLVIIEAGEPDLIYDAIAAADSSKRKYVSIITHHPANDESADDPNKNLSNILTDFNTVTEDRIPDQNINLQTPIGDWDWAKSHPDERITWLYSQGKIAEQDTVVGFQKGKFDCSDAGMVFYHLTGEKQATVTMLQELFNTHVGFEFTPHEVPGIIQFEDYDFGGNEVSYFDKTQQDPSQYSYRNVDLVDLGRNGAVVSSIEEGEWLQYTIMVKQTGFYKLSVNHSTTVVPGVEAFKVIHANEGDTLVNSFTCLYTGRSDYFLDVVGQLYLTQGEHVLQFWMLNSGFVLDYMNLEFISAPYQLLVDSAENGEVSVSPQKEIYLKGEEVVITATPHDGFVFSSWSGDYSSAENPLTITFDDSNISVKAIFDSPSTIDQATRVSPKVYPNPNNGHFTIAVGEGKFAKFKLYNLSGELADKANFKSQMHVKYNDLNKGIYFIEIESEEEFVVKRLVIR